MHVVAARSATDLLSQRYLLDEQRSVAEALQQAAGGLSVRAFARLQAGEGLEKKASDFAEEVQKLAGGV
jgi:elongation factor Ts